MDFKDRQPIIENCLLIRESLSDKGHVLNINDSPDIIVQRYPLSDPLRRLTETYNIDISENKIQARTMYVYVRFKNTGNMPLENFYIHVYRNHLGLYNNPKEWNKYKLATIDGKPSKIERLDTSPGIFNSVRYAEKKMGFAPIEDSQLTGFVGPPPKEMYMKTYKISEETAMQAAKYHREYGRKKAVSEAYVYNGIPELLDKLKKSGLKLAVATLKSQNIAEKILNNFNLAKYFDAIIGMDASESMTKCQTILSAIKKTQASDKVLLVGDSPYDLIGANEAGVDFIGVLYGFGFNENNIIEFDNHVFVNAVSEILKFC